MSVRHAARAALGLSDPIAKVEAVFALWRDASEGRLGLDPMATAGQIAATTCIPGRPERPHLVHPREVAQRSVHKLEGRAALLHAVVHIEFNAINLALDAVWRFAGMPEPFYQDWLRVAREEAEHFTMLNRHMQHMGWQYGDFVAHDGLWAMCEKTADDIVARMALVPRTLEARGLDATPLIQRRLRAINAEDAQTTATLLDTILRDEIGHVAIGNHWYRWLCEREGLDAVRHYGVLVERYAAPRLKPPFNETARKQAGFSQEELDYLLFNGPG